MIKHFISDLHLSEEHPHLLRMFDRYLKHYAPEANELYILGDLFEVWIGDDYLPEWLIEITNSLSELSKSTKIYFCHGNRDFLVGERFAKSARISLLSDYSVVDLEETPILLCHGDTLCTDDVAYQNFRDEVRTDKWQTEFLNLPIEKRLAIANGYRQQSKEATTDKSNDIMDVNQQAVDETFKKFNVDFMIHGHTHRPATHVKHQQYRIVLSDWGKQGQFLEFKNGALKSFRFDEHGRFEDTEVTGCSVHKK
ncbi:UDP-2,3-diacylglucosamine diphosphatase [Pleionea sediminis]|uniref:UDP-2,3-diacylglucosamine diphosphatase n=1 Tax=Pleionea sediminis TaxID=2569479 RepID=UPI00197B1870|nr:UDP-2,3-diacylglucosamine diphosphatase [Pleionea sediminis]